MGAKVSPSNTAVIITDSTLVKNTTKIVLTMSMSRVLRSGKIRRDNHRIREIDRESKKRWRRREMEQRETENEQERERGEARFACFFFLSCSGK